MSPTERWGKRRWNSCPHHNQIKIASSVIYKYNIWTFSRTLMDLNGFLLLLLLCSFNKVPEWLLYSFFFIFTGLTCTAYLLEKTSMLQNEKKKKGSTPIHNCNNYFLVWIFEYWMIFCGNNISLIFFDICKYISHADSSVSENSATCTCVVINHTELSDTLNSL